MALYKSTFEKLVAVLTCQRCKKLFSEPVVLWCRDNICLACARDVLSKEKESDNKGWYPCPVCLDDVPLREDFDGYTYNRQLGKAALVTNVMKELISVGCSTARRLTSDRDSGVGNEDGRSEASFVTGHSLASMEPPPNLAPGGALLHNMERYKPLFEKLVNVLTCPRCKNLFSDPVIMDCGHSICSSCAADSVSKEGGIWCDCPVCGEKDLERCSNTQLGKAALVVNVINKVMAWWYNTVRRVTSDRDSGVGSEDGRSKASFVTGVSWASMEPPPNMAAGGALFYHFTVELYKWAFQELVNVLTCQRCNDVFTDPVIMYCGHSICFVCAVDIELEAKNKRYPCPLCGDLQIRLRYCSNSELGEAALVANEMKAVISGGSTARRVPSDPDSGVRSADARSEACFVTAYSWASMELPPNMAQGGALLYQFSTGLYKLALQEVGDVLTCPQCKKLFTNPVVMDCGHNLCLACAADTPSKHEGGRQCPVCGCKQAAFYSNNHQLGKAALLANVTKEVISLVTSDQDSGIGSEDARSEASFVSGHSQAGMDHPPNMLPDGAGVPDGLNNVKHNQILSWVTSAGSMEPPNRASNKGSISSPEPPPSMAPGTELEMSSIPDVGDQGGSEGQEEHIGTASNCTLTSRAHRFHPYPARPDRTKSSSLHALWELMTDSRIDGGFVEDVIVACQGVLGNSTSIQAPEHPDPTNTAVRDLK
ncbi:uncharacterized protein LOC122814045 [Protopterus annectens]|uniref:uncharacterized protein LOC122814045 n=1 Tax=Protopterus annectens TaxID=7888 RepID=UPI001CFA7BC2|nr:uncharacterized protein LOC122814045 [Protopterus annectens]